MTRISFKLTKILFESNLRHAASLKFLGRVCHSFEFHKARKNSLYNYECRGYPVYTKKLHYTCGKIHHQILSTWKPQRLNMMEFSNVKSVCCEITVTQLFYQQGSYIIKKYWKGDCHLDSLQSNVHGSSIVKL